ncbi:MAG TPA: hypothetical protein VFS44_04070 [Gemmatimonadaceae bacterium]|nr:hypothetical protein [Gemmatimonadaceae bacterium]
MTRTIRLFLLIEGATYAVASLVHRGALVAGYAHRQAAVAESVIAVVLLAGLVLGWLVPAWTRLAGLAAQTFALLATLLGLFMIAIGIGPRTVPDVIYHIAIVAVLAWGLVVAGRFPTAAELDEGAEIGS